jgi:hypothetical protein
MEQNNEERYFITDEGETVDIYTGEVIPINEIKKAKQNKIIQTWEEETEDIRDLGLKNELLIVKHRGETLNCVEVKKSYYFNKQFRTTMQDLILNGDLSKNAQSFFFGISAFISFPSNSIIVKGKVPSNEKLEEITKLPRTSYYNAANELEEKEVIAKLKRNGQSIIYVNPFIITAGAFVEYSTLLMFKDSIYNPTHKFKK